MFCHVILIASYTTYITVADPSVSQRGEGVMFESPDFSAGVGVVHAVIHPPPTAWSVGVGAGSIVGCATRCCPCGLQAGHLLFQHAHLLLQCEHLLHHRQVLATCGTGYGRR